MFSSSFNVKKIPFYITMFILVLIFSTFGKHVKDFFKKQTENDEYELVRKYLLNDSSLYGYNKPKLWIHTKYERNSRVWKSFSSRSSLDLNQPYLHVTIKSIIDHCGDDFNICLIDDHSFSKLLPLWKTNISSLPESEKQKFRQYGMMSLLHTYGGMIIPNSFLCFQNLKHLYEIGISQNTPFLCESINNTMNAMEKKRMLYIPDILFMGVEKKENPTIQEMIHFLKKRCDDVHVSCEDEFRGTFNTHCLLLIKLNKMILIGGEIIGIKTASKERILLDDLMEEKELNLHSKCCGIYIAQDEILKRTKYQWFASLSINEIIKSNSILSKYLQLSMVDTTTIIPSQVNTI